MKKMGQYVKHRTKLAKRRGFLVTPPTRTAPDVDARAESGERYGHQLERRALHLFTVRPSPEWSAGLPYWFRGMRRAPHEDDQAGIDLWVSTDVGDVAVQVKSSAKRAKLFRERHPGMEVAIIVLHLDMTDEQVRDRVMGAVGAIVDAKGLRKEAA